MAILNLFPLIPQVEVTTMSSGCVSKVEIQVTNTYDDNLVLHWGGICDNKE